MTLPTRLALGCAIGLGAVLSALAQSRPTTGPTAPTTSAADATRRVVDATQALLAKLDATGRAKVQFPFHGPQKARWSNLPTGIFAREGLRLADLSPAQRTAAMAVVAAALSPQGYRKVVDIMEGDEVLRRGANANGPAGGGRRPTFGKDEYYLAFVGTPSSTTPWMLQFGGHHLAINLTLGSGGQASMTPSLPATQPGSFTVEGRSIRPLGGEVDKGLALVTALSDQQREHAVLKYRVADLVLGAGQDGRTIQPEGIRASALTPPQQAMLLDLVGEWTGIMADAYAGPRLAEIAASLPQTYFAWSGATTAGSASYFRIQGPTLVIEFSPQGSLDHIHTIYRDPTNDYGARFAGAK